MVILSPKEVHILKRNCLNGNRFDHCTNDVEIRIKQETNSFDIFEVTEGDNRVKWQEQIAVVKQNEI